MRSSYLFAGLALGAVIASLGPGAVARADERDFMGLFGGAWSGGGFVLNDGTPTQVNCRAVGHTDLNHVTIAGDCNVWVFSAPIAADIAYDPGTDRYSGIYIGAPVGPARVTGTRSGDVVDLVITWPAPVNGDTHARMTIVNAGNGSVRILVSDNLKPGGPDLPVSDLSLTIKGSNPSAQVIRAGARTGPQD